MIIVLFLLHIHVCAFPESFHQSKSNQQPHLKHVLTQIPHTIPKAYQIVQNMINNNKSEVSEMMQRKVKVLRGRRVRSAIHADACGVLLVPSECGII